MFVFNIEQGLYAMLGVYISSKTIDVIQVGLNRSKMAMIITNREEEVRHAVLNKIDRGITKISAVGGYTDDEAAYFDVRGRPDRVHKAETTRKTH